MKITDELISHSIFNEDLLKLEVEKGYYTDIFINNDLCKELIIEYNKSARLMINILIKELRNQDFSAAKKCLGFHGEFGLYPAELINLRTEIKSLVIGLVKTSAITNVSEVEKYKEEWKVYENDSKYIHHQFVFNFFKMVKTTEHLIGFNNFFRYYLIRLGLNLYEILTKRVHFTLKYLEVESICK